MGLDIITAVFPYVVKVLALSTLIAANVLIWTLMVGIITSERKGK